jgi:hypothetical protein
MVKPRKLKQRQERRQQRANQEAARQAREREAREWEQVFYLKHRCTPRDVDKAIDKPGSAAKYAAIHRQTLVELTGDALLPRLGRIVADYATPPRRRAPPNRPLGFHHDPETQTISYRWQWPTIEPAQPTRWGVMYNLEQQ